MTKKPVYKRWWFILLIVIIAIGVIGAVAGGSEEDQDKNSAQAVSQNSSDSSEEQAEDSQQKEDEISEEENLVDGFEVTGEFTEERDDYFLYISGSVKNRTGKELNYAQIIFNLYDKDGAQIGTAVDNINSIREDGVWKFKAMALENAEDIASWELASIDSF